MRLHLDRTLCDGHGACAELLPDLIDLDEWGFPLLRGGADPQITPERRRIAARAVRACPLMALHLRAD